MATPLHTAAASPRSRGRAAHASTVLACASTGGTVHVHPDARAADADWTWARACRRAWSQARRAGDREWAQAVGDLADRLAASALGCGLERSDAGVWARTDDLNRRKRPLNPRALPSGKAR